MDEMIRYIFGSLRCSESAMNRVARDMTKQRSFNNSVAFFAIAAAIIIVLHEREICNLKAQIKLLKKEIKEQQHVEGD